MFIDCFINSERPVLDHPSVKACNDSVHLMQKFNSHSRQNIPDVLSTEDATRLRDSFHVQPTDQVNCAASVRLWEELLERYRLPFLLLRVADMRYTTRGPGGQMPALHLYIEVSFYYRRCHPCRSSGRFSSGI